MGQFQQILLSALGVVLTGFLCWLSSKVTAWIDAKISDKKAAAYFRNINDIATNAVKETYQTYVETLKESGTFDKAAQEKAKENCLAKIKEQLAPEAIEYIKSNFGDTKEYLSGLVESIIYTLKIQGK